MLVEGSGEDEDGAPVVVGRTYREAPEVDGMVVAYGTAEPGTLVTVRVTASGDYDLFGEVASPVAARQ
jgi:ribosomal protein S12 methylthiotransferase